MACHRVCSPLIRSSIQEGTPFLQHDRAALQSSPPDTIRPEPEEERLMLLVTLEEAQARLAELIAALTPGEELSITANGETIARLARVVECPRVPRQPGSAKGKILYMADDFDAPLE